MGDRMGWENNFRPWEKNSRGVCILFHPQFDTTILNTTPDPQGRYLIAEIKINNNLMTLCNIYGPNKDTPSFFTDIFTKLDTKHDEKVIMGDFNLVLDPEIDRYGSNYNNHYASSLLRELMSEYELFDPWRTYNPNCMRFSWRKRNPRLQASRLDFALVSKGLDIENTLYIPAIKTDHDAFFLTVSTEKESRGPGYWKLNTNLLKDPTFVQEMNVKLEELIDRYRDHHPHDAWEKMKTDILKFVKNKSRKKASEKQVAISQLYEKIADLEDKELPLSIRDEEILENSIKELDDLVEEHTKSLIFRSRVKWVEEGEKNTRYFYNLEKSRFKAKTVYKLINDQNQEVTSTKEILEMEREHYQNLYSIEEGVCFKLENNTDIKVNNEERAEQNSKLEMKELSIALDSLKNGKCPGPDGLPAEFYKTFWVKLKPVLHRIYSVSHSEKRLPESLRHGVLNLIPKGGKDARFLKNLRPITLLNTDYKIIEKTVSNRMQKSLERIIHEDQKGFLPGRKIATNIRKALDIVRYCDQNQIASILLSLDFQKCFDQISMSAIMGAVRFFDYGQYIQDWTEILYTDFFVTVQNNGYFSDKIWIQRGVHQGGCCSISYFLLVAEILALTLRKDREIQGIPVNDIIYLLSQFADDMDLFLIYSQQTLNRVLQIFEDFWSSTGFSLSYDKTKIMRIGSLKDSDAKLYTQKNLHWTGDPINILGICVANDEEHALVQNYQEMLTKIRTTLNKWRRRNLSLIGKVNIINTLIGSLFVYKMMVLPNLTNTMLKNFESEFSKFLWNDRKAKIPLRSLQTSKQVGGLKLVDLAKKEMSQKISWIKILQEDSNIRNLVMQTLSPVINMWIFDCELLPEDVKHLEIPSKFWNDMLTAWCYFNKKIKNKDMEINNKDEIIWWNSRIRVQGKPFLWEHAVIKGLYRIKQLYHGCKPISPEEANVLYGLTTLEYNAIMTAIPQEIKRNIRSEVELFWSSNYADLLDKKELTKYIYEELIRYNPRLSALEIKWTELLLREVSTDELCKEFININKMTNIPKLRSFQYRLLNNAIVTNIQLFHWGIMESKNCTFCNLNDENIIHLFCTCLHVKKLWEELESLFSKHLEVKPIFSIENILWNKIHPKPGHAANLMCTVVKQYIYRVKCEKKRPVYKEIRDILYKTENTEKYIAQKNNKMAQHMSKWAPVHEKTPNTSLDIYVQEYLATI